MTQAQFAKRLGTGQSAIARLEDPEYGKHSIALLNRIAEAFDVSLWVEFVSFATLIKRTSNNAPANLTALPYEKEFDKESGEPFHDVPLSMDGGTLDHRNYLTPVPGNLSIGWSVGTQAGTVSLKEHSK